MSERVALRHATAEMFDRRAGVKKMVVVYYYKVPTSIHPSYTVQPVQSMATDVI
jgi:hypothetical protein